MPSPAPRRIAAVAATTVAVCALALTPLAANAAIVTDPIVSSADDAAIALAPIGTFETGAFDEGASEIVAAYGDRLFVVNAQAGSVSVLDASDPGAMSQEFAIGSDGVANSVAVRADGLGVVAFEAETKTDPGHLLFFDANAATPEAAILGTVTVGALPDMVTVVPDGKYALVANEGEPSEVFDVDPEGSVSVVKLPNKVAAPRQKDVKTADFHAYEAGGKALPDGVRVFGPTVGEGYPVSRNLEPEYITTVGNNAYVTLQEANAIAVVQIPSARVTDILPLGAKDWSTSALDPSDKDGVFAQRSFAGLKGLYMPDGIQSYTAGGASYLVTANEGDVREWGDYVDAVRVKDLGKNGLAPVCATSPLAAFLKDKDLGRLNVSVEDGFDAAAGCYDELYAYGGRSFSIWTTDGAQVFDSGSDFERIAALAPGSVANANHTDSNSFDTRSDDKGPEPEGVALGVVDGRTYAFIGFERVSGIAVYDITVPASATFVTYVNNRDFSAPATSPEAGDLGPEGLAFIPAASSSTGEPMLAVGNEVSGTTTLYAISRLTD